MYDTIITMLYYESEFVDHLTGNLAVSATCGGRSTQTFYLSRGISQCRNTLLHVQTMHSKCYLRKV